MRRWKQEIGETKEIEKILENALICRIGLADGNSPYVVPVNFTYKDGHLYFHSAKEGKKIEIISRNNAVCFEVDLSYGIEQAAAPCKWNNRYLSVIGFGKAHFLQKPEEKRTALEAIFRHYSDAAPEFPEDNLENVAVIDIVIASMTGKRSSAF